MDTLSGQASLVCEIGHGSGQPCALVCCQRFFPSADSGSTHTRKDLLDKLNVALWPTLLKDSADVVERIFSASNGVSIIDFGEL